LNNLGNNPGHYSRNNSVPSYEKVGNNIYINEGFEISEVDENGYGGRPITTEAYKLEKNSSSRNLYKANPAIYVHEASLQNPAKKEKIENDIRDALWAYSKNQMSTQNSHVEIHGDGTLQVY
jgi:hypothetical protein